MFVPSLKGKRMRTRSGLPHEWETNLEFWQVGLGKWLVGVQSYGNEVSNKKSVLYGYELMHAVRVKWYSWQLMHCNYVESR